MAEQSQETPHRNGAATGRVPAHMNAVVYSAYGGPEELALDSVATPTPDDDEVLLRVVAASVNAGDRHLMRGRPLPVRLVYGGYVRPRFPILGADVAGRVEGVGRAVTAFEPGDVVFGDLSGCGFGGFAEYVAAPETAFVSKPPVVPYEDAAAVPTAGVTALQSLRDAGALRSGETVLINGASGGVGTFAVQIAKALGAEVTGVCSTAKMTVVRSIGADHVVDYSEVDVTEAGGQFDLIIDTAGSRSIVAYRRVLTPTGRYVFVGGPTGRFVTAAVLGPLLSRANGRRMGAFLLEPDRRDLELLVDLLESGDVEPVIDRRFRLHEVPHAIRHFESGRTAGKIVITEGEGTHA